MRSSDHMALDLEEAGIQRHHLSGGHCALRKDLRSFFESTLVSSSADIATETVLIEYLRGTGKSVGLVQHAMFLLSRRKDFLYPELTLSRNFHDESLSPNQVPEAPTSPPAVPSLASIKESRAASLEEA